VLGKNASIRSKLPTAACWSREKREEGARPICFMSKATSVPQANHSQYSSPVEAINLIVKSKFLPVEINLTKVVPVFKSGEDTDPNNYCPESLLSIFSRILERLMYKRLKSFFEMNGLFYESQYGFREKHSPQHALIDIVKHGQRDVLYWSVYRSEKGG